MVQSRPHLLHQAQGKLQAQPRQTRVSWQQGVSESLTCAGHVGGSAEVTSKPSVKELLGSLPYGPAPESPAVAEAWLDDHGRSFGHFIGNQWVKPEGRATYDSYNPATGQRLATTIQGMRL